MIAFGQVPADCRVGGRHEISNAFAAAIAQSETGRAGETRIVLRITQGSQVQILPRYHSYVPRPGIAPASKDGAGG